MPSGVPVATTAIDGGTNAGLIAASIIALQDKKVAMRLEKFRSKLTKSVRKKPKKR